jgi:hypothetical protein
LGAGKSSSEIKRTEMFIHNVIFEPSEVSVNGEKTDFRFDAEDKELRFELPIKNKRTTISIK